MQKDEASGTRESIFSSFHGVGREINEYAVSDGHLNAHCEMATRAMMMVQI